MNVYSVKLESLGEMSQLPDSQKIFGALVYLLLDDQKPDSKTVDEFITGIKEGSTFSVSSLLPAGYFPVPKSHIERVAHEKNCTDNDDAKEFYSELKKRDFMKIKDIETIINCPKELFLQERPNLRICTEQQVHVNTEWDNLSEEEQKNLIFSVQRIVFKNEKDVLVKPDSFEFFIRCGTDNVIMKLLEKKVTEEHIFTLGKRSSQGYNLFKLKEVKKCPRIEEKLGSRANAYLNLGMLLPNPDCVDFTASSLELFTSERRRYDSGSNNDGKAKWDESKERGHFISFIAPGSVVVLKGNMETIDNLKPIDIGKCVPLPADEGKAIVSGKSFLYPLEGI